VKKIQKENLFFFLFLNGSTFDLSQSYLKISKSKQFLFVISVLLLTLHGQSIILFLKLLISSVYEEKCFHVFARSGVIDDDQLCIEEGTGGMPGGE
jgi:hypothetical protein